MRFPVPASLTAALIVVLCTAPGVGWAQGAIEPDPARPLPGFKSHHLSFHVPADGVARAEYRSVPFFAVILKSARRCSLTEEERLAAQRLFPAAKVFATRFGCDEEPEDNVTYTNVNADFAFIALYAGQTSREADALLARVKATGRFPDANIRRMQAVMVYP